MSLELLANTSHFVSSIGSNSHYAPYSTAAPHHTQSFKNDDHFHHDHDGSSSCSSDDEEGKIFKCTIDNCNREFTSRRNLVDHTRGHHSGAKPHVCEFPGCGKSFLRPAHLIIHNRIHTGEKPFVCEYPGCGKRWNQKSALKQHLRSHTGEKPFLCDINGCQKRFSTSSSCKRHMLTHEKGPVVTVGNAPALNNKRKANDFESTPGSPSSSLSSPLSSPPSSPSISFMLNAPSMTQSAPASPNPSKKMALLSVAENEKVKMAVNFLLN